MIELKELDLNTILYGAIGLSLSLKPGIFYQMNETTVSRVFWSAHRSEFIPHDAVAIGIPILEIKKKLYLLPGVIGLIQNVPEFRIDKEAVFQVSRGKDITIEEKDGVVILVDHFGRRIAFGICEKGSFHPLIDIGWYIREGS